MNSVLIPIYNLTSSHAYEDVRLVSGSLYSEKEYKSSVSKQDPVEILTAFYSDSAKIVEEAIELSRKSYPLLVK